MVASSWKEVVEKKGGKENAETCGVERTKNIGGDDEVEVAGDRGGRSFGVR